MVQNGYPRVVTECGNMQAQQLIQTYFEPCDRNWRGIGEIGGSGLGLRPEYREFDAERRFAIGPLTAATESHECQSGLVLQGGLEWAPRSGLGNVDFVRSSFWVQAYTTLFYPKTVLALRMGGQELFGKDLPVQVLLPIGGNSSLRGSPQDRYLGKSSVLTNVELRFPVFWRFGGVLGVDAGKGGVHFREPGLHGRQHLRGDPLQVRQELQGVAGERRLVPLPPPGPRQPRSAALRLPAFSVRLRDALHGDAG